MKKIVASTFGFLLGAIAVALIGLVFLLCRMM